MSLILGDNNYYESCSKVYCTIQLSWFTISNRVKHILVKGKIEN